MILVAVTTPPQKVAQLLLGPAEKSTGNPKSESSKIPPNSHKDPYGDRMTEKAFGA